MRTLLVSSLAASALALASATSARADEPAAAPAAAAPAVAAPAAPAAAPPAAPATPPAPDAAPADDAITATRVGPFVLGAKTSEVIDAALKIFKKDDVKLGDKDITLPGLKLRFTAAGAKGVLDLVEITKGGAKYRTAEGVGPGTSEKDIRLAYRDAVKRTKQGKLDSLTPDALPNVHFICSKGGLFSAESCKTINVTRPVKKSGK